jgi:hypothetical protein
MISKRLAFLIATLGALPALALAQGKPAATVQEIMDTHIDPSADTLWGSVGTVLTKDGSRFHQPTDDAQWKKLRAVADDLVKGSGLLAQAREVGANGNSALADATTPGVRTAAQIKQDIAADPARFAKAALRLQQGGLAAARAIDAHDGQALLVAGAQMDAACEACHAAYWYPRTPPLHLPSDDEFKLFPARTAPKPPHPAFSAGN